ncbi:transposase [Candidatus Bathyarchaeota archaeon]|nr:transposase [Candidatus Bathyarchaeota archaeon]
MTLITDGLPAYHDAYKKEYWTMKKETRTEHIGHITIRGDHNNNKIERFNGEVRDREKVMRSLKKVDTPILSGYQIYHNFVRPHMALNGKTPAQKANIESNEARWMSLIKKASQHQRFETSS